MCPFCYCLYSSWKALMVEFVSVSVDLIISLFSDADWDKPVMISAIPWATSLLSLSEWRSCWRMLNPCSVPKSVCFDAVCIKRWSRCVAVELSLRSYHVLKSICVYPNYDRLQGKSSLQDKDVSATNYLDGLMRSLFDSGILDRQLYLTKQFFNQKGWVVRFSYPGAIVFNINSYDNTVILYKWSNVCCVVTPT